MTIDQFTSIVPKHDYELRNFAMRFTRDLDEANDLIQDTMVKAIRYIGHFQDGTNLKAWLFTIMRNTYINTYRKEIKSRVLM